MEEQELIFTNIPQVIIASNTFSCQIPIRYKDEPMLEFIKEMNVYDARIPIYHSDGTKMAIVKGRNVYATEEGKKAGIKLLHPSLSTICEMNGKTLFEIRRQAASAVKMTAELFTHDGYFLKWSENFIDCININGSILQVGGLQMSGCFLNAPVGIQIGDTTNPLPTAIHYGIRN